MKPTKNLTSQEELIDDDEEFQIEDDIKKYILVPNVIYSSRKDSYKKHLEEMHPHKIQKTKSELPIVNF